LDTINPQKEQKSLFIKKFRKLKRQKKVENLAYLEKIKTRIMNR